jgi:phosphate/phosphite/phosphonate ABC transporter binding protein
MKKLYNLVAVAGVLALGLGLAACGSSNNSSSRSSSGSAAAKTTSHVACPNGTLTFGVEPYDNASALIPAYQAMSTALGKALGCKINLQIAESYVAEILAMRNGKLDMGEFGPAGFVFASQQASAVPLASYAQSNGQLSTYTAGIWVKKGSPITNLKQLAGHTLALSSVGSTSGDWEPRYALIQAGVSGKVKTEYAGGSPRVARGAAARQGRRVRDQQPYRGVRGGVSHLRPVAVHRDLEVGTDPQRSGLRVRVAVGGSPDRDQERAAHHAVQRLHDRLDHARHRAGLHPAARRPRDARGHQF